MGGASTPVAERGSGYYATSGAVYPPRIAGATPWTRRNFARWLFEDHPRSLITTPRRWHRGMFAGPGAYR